MITIHHLENSVSNRIVWLLEELGADYEIKIYARDGLFAPAEYRDLHPAGTSPILTDGDVVMAETNAIADYLLDKFPNNPLRPAPNTRERTRYLYWFHTAMGSFAPMQLLLFIFSRMVLGAPFFVRPFIVKITDKFSEFLPKPRIQRLLTAMNDELNNSQWLSGDIFTVADITLVQCLENHAAKNNLNNYPNVQVWLKRASERDAYLRASKKVGGFVTGQGK